MEQEHTVEVAPSRTGMSRRVIVKSAAWSVPVFATVGVTPAFAATGDPILQSVSLSATRPTRAPGKIVNFTWAFQWAPDAAVSNVGVIYSQPAGFTVTGPNTLTTSPLNFTGENGQANVLTVPSFTITVTFTYKTQTRSATFTVTVPGDSLASGATVAGTAAPGVNNPIVTA